MDVITLFVMCTVFIVFVFFLLWMVTDHIKTIFELYREDNADRRIADVKLAEALNNIAEALKDGRQNQQVAKPSTSNDRVVHDDYTPQSSRNIETKPTVAIGIRDNVATSIEEAGIANMVLKSTKSPVAFGEES